MKQVIWIVTVLACLAGVDRAQAQFYSGYGSAGYGIGFGYSSRRFSIGGFFGRSYSSGYLLNPYFGPAFYGGGFGAVQTRIIQNVYTPTVVVMPQQKQYAYDVTGVDLDLVHPPAKLGPGGLDKNGNPKPPPEPPIPGKDVSVPKKPVRPGQQPPPKQPPGQPQPPKMPPPQPPGPVPPEGPLPNPKDEAVRQIGQGVVAFKDKSYGLAAQHFQRAIDLDSTNSLGWFLRAQAEFALGHYKEAVASIHEGMKRRPDWPTAKFRPRFQLYKGNEAAFDAHLKRLDEVVKQNPKSAIFLFLSAHQRWFDNQREEALKLFRRARPSATNPADIDRFLNAGKGKTVVANS